MRKQSCLEDFGYSNSFSMGGAEMEGFGAGAQANSLDHSDLRGIILEAMSQHDEEALAHAIDRARELSQDY